MKVCQGSTRQNCCLIWYSSLCDKGSFALSSLLIISACHFAVYVHVCACMCVVRDADKTNDQTAMESDDISLSYLSDLTHELYSEYNILYIYMCVFACK